jgi:predicted amidohydrolase
MPRPRWSSYLALVAALLALLIASPATRAQAPTVTLFESARLLTGDGGVIENSAFIVANDRFVGVGRRGELPPPPGAARVDLAGKTVMPALVDDHVHMGYRSGTSFSADNAPARTCSTYSIGTFTGVAAILGPVPGAATCPTACAAKRIRVPHLTSGGFGVPNAGPAR